MRGFDDAFIPAAAVAVYERSVTALLDELESVLLDEHAVRLCHLVARRMLIQHMLRDAQASRPYHKERAA